MKGMLHGNDLMIRIPVLQICVFSCRFQCSFHGFRTAVGKEDTIHTGCFLYCLGSFDRRHIIIIIGGMKYLVHLCFYGIVICFVAVAEGKHADPGYKIQIRLSFNIIKMHALTVIKYHLIPVIGMQ